MGIFGMLFGTKVNCPSCGTPGAKQSLLGTACRMKTCKYYNHHYAAKCGGADYQPANMPYMGGSVDQQAAAMPRGKSKFRNPIWIEYVNFRDERKVFEGDKRSLRRRGRHVSVCVAPRGWRIALKLEKIVNLAEVQQALGN